jgi:hypothetical protein
MELTVQGISRSLRPAFQEYDLEKLDPEQDAFTVIERTLAYGNREELAWLFTRYSVERLAAWVQEWRWRSLPRTRLLLWAAYFGLENLPKRRNVWPH